MKQVVNVICTRIAPSVLLAVTVATAQAASAAPQLDAGAYMITTVMYGPGGSVRSQELFSLGIAGGTTVAQLMDRSGEMVIAPASVDRNGLVDTATRHPAIVCYDLAMSVLANAASRTMTSPLSIAFAGGTVTVPLALVSAPSTDGMQNITARGITEAMLADGAAGMPVTFVASGDVTSRRGALVTARFDEVGILKSTGAAVTRMSCGVTKLQGSASPVTARAI
jgi:hypothetical protein